MACPAVAEPAERDRRAHRTAVTIVLFYFLETVEVFRYGCGPACSYRSWYRTYLYAV